MTDDPIELLYYAGRALWLSVLVGDPAPATLQLRNRMKQPRPGDLVIEISSFNQTFDPDSVGRLVRIENAHDMGLCRHVTAPLGRPGEEQGWRNAEFVAIPDRRSSDRWAQPAKETNR
ncbi:hypothetical protein [Kitasatospora sp. NBC_01302]|uniref:hypothetical protein n=1 Tax=Kitasatospora sp. NBC_01302 TaxID=2903575 RepID=UPI002E15B0BD|nr:hypothetical protein OG294_13930 [Kitasatospora sp. NBC_01302]